MIPQLASFDHLVHAPMRLLICAVLDKVERVEVANLCEVLDAGDVVVHKHLKTLEEGGYISYCKNTFDRRQGAAVVFTPAGHQAYRAHVATLKRIVD